VLSHEQQQPEPPGASSSTRSLPHVRVLEWRPGGTDAAYSNVVEYPNPLAALRHKTTLILFICWSQTKDSHERKCCNLSIFFLVTAGEGASQVDLPSASRQLNPALEAAKGKSSQELFRPHILIATAPLTVLRWFWMICLRLASSSKKDLAQVAFDLIGGFHVSSE